MRPTQTNSIRSLCSQSERTKNTIQWFDSYKLNLNKLTQWAIAFLDALNTDQHTKITDHELQLTCVSDSFVLNSNSFASSINSRYQCNFKLTLLSI